MNRRALLTTLGAAYALSATKVSAEDESRHIVTGQIIDNNSLLRFITPSDDLQTILNDGIRLIVLDPKYVYTFSEINLPSGTTIVGNGASVKSASNDSGIFKIHRSISVSIHDVNFMGKVSGLRYSESLSPKHIAIEVYKSANVTIDNCSFNGFLGAGVNMYNYHESFLNRTINIKVTNCSFANCQYGFLAWYQCEYGILNGNNFSQCNCAIWNNSGNWVITGNSVTDCLGGYICVAGTNPIAFSVGSNLAHGNVTGNTFNHSKQSKWRSSPLRYNNSNSIVGNIFDGVLPTTYTGNAHWYTDLTYANYSENFYVTGCTFSKSRIVNKSSNAINLTGCWVRERDFSGKVNQI